MRMPGGGWFQFLDMHHKAAIAFDQHYLSVATRGGHADRN
jgi:hypothetical protein